MRRVTAVVLILGYQLLPLAAVARDFDFSKPTPEDKSAPPRLTTPGPTRVIPPPPNVGAPPVVAPTPVAAPAATPAPAVPKFEVTTTQYDLPTGTRFSASIVRELVYNLTDSLAMTLEVADDVKDGGGGVVIPRGSTVWGSFQPVASKPDEDSANARREPRDRSQWPEGSRFVAERVSIGDRIYSFKAQTELLPTQADPRRDVGAEAGSGALIGVAGGALLTIFTGGLGLIPILAGGAIGAGVGAVSASQPVVLVKPDKPLTLTLVEPLRVR